jgi:IclR family acetate operon transcriptional repressor
VAQVETHEAIRAFFPPGTKGPMHSSGIGKALMAWYPEDQAAGHPRPAGLEKFTS